jgi:hypothetical protein
MAEIDYSPRFTDPMSANMLISELQGRLEVARHLNDRLHETVDALRLSVDSRSTEVEQLMEILNGCEGCSVIAKLVALEVV